MSPSVFIVTRRKGADGAWVSAKCGPSAEVRYVVRYRLGGRGARIRHGGSFRTRREAEQRGRFIAGELAARRIPDVGELVPPPASRRVALGVRCWRDERSCDARERPVGPV